MMKLDNLLNIIIPLDLGLKGKNEALRRGVKLMMAVLVVLAIVVSAIGVTLDMCPEGVADWYVWVMVAWRIFLHTLVYCVIIGVLMVLEGTLKDVFKGKKKPTTEASPAAQTTADENEEENTFFSSDIDEEALTAYIKSNPNKFTSGEDMAIFFLILSDRSFIGTSKKEFHKFLSSLIECKGYTQLSNGCLRVKEVLNYHSMDETRQKIVTKYEEMEKIIQKFIKQ